MSCTEFGNVADELALGILYGEERRRADHVETAGRAGESSRC